MKVQRLRTWLKKGVALSYSTEPQRLEPSRTWTPPGMLFDLAWIGLFLGLACANALLR